jgi:hypothetical protein
MKPYYEDNWVTLYHADCREVPLGPGTVACVVTSPPTTWGWTTTNTTTL